MEWIIENREVGGRLVTTRRLKPVERQADPEPGDDYSSMTKAALISLAEGRSIEVSSRMTKAKIIAALEEAD